MGVFFGAGDLEFTFTVLFLIPSPPRKKSRPIEIIMKINLILKRVIKTYCFVGMIQPKFKKTVFLYNGRDVFKTKLKTAPALQKKLSGIYFGSIMPTNNIPGPKSLRFPYRLS